MSSGLVREPSGQCWVLTPVVQRGPIPGQKEARKVGGTESEEGWGVEGQPGEGAGVRSPGTTTAPPPPAVLPGEDSPDHRAAHLASATPAAHLARPLPARPRPTSESAQPRVLRVGGIRAGDCGSRREGAEGHWPWVASTPAASPQVYPYSG